MTAIPKNLTTPESRGNEWWNWRLFGLWILINSAAYAVIVVGGVALEELASATTRELVDDHRPLAVLLVAIIGSGLQGTVLGRW